MTDSTERLIEASNWTDNRGALLDNVFVVRTDLAAILSTNEALARENEMILRVALEAGYRACERGWNLQKTLKELG